MSDDHLRREVKTRKHSVFKFFYLEAWSNGLSSRILSGWNDWDTLEHERMEYFSFRGEISLPSSMTVMIFDLNLSN